MAINNNGSTLRDALRSNPTQATAFVKQLLQKGYTENQVQSILSQKINTQNGDQNSISSTIPGVGSDSNNTTPSATNDTNDTDTNTKVVDAKDTEQTTDNDPVSILNNLDFGSEDTLKYGTAKADNGKPVAEVVVKKKGDQITATASGFDSGDTTQSTSSQKSKNQSSTDTSKSKKGQQVEWTITGKSSDTNNNGSTQNDTSTQDDEIKLDGKSVKKGESSYSKALDWIKDAVVKNVQSGNEFKDDDSNSSNQNRSSNNNTSSSETGSRKNQVKLISDTSSEGNGNNTTSPDDVEET